MKKKLALQSAKLNKFCCPLRQMCESETSFDPFSDFSPIQKQNKKKDFEFFFLVFAYLK